MPTANFLAFDLGAESGRAMLGLLENDRLTLEEKHRFANPNGKLNQHYHWDLLAQWEQLKIGLHKSASPTVLIHGIGIDTWGVDFGLLDINGDLLANPFMYRDPHTNGILDHAYALIPREQIFRETGVQLMQFNSVFQLLAMARAGSPLLNIAQRLLFIPDLFNYLLTGIQKNEFSITSTSQMYDPASKTWATGLMQRLGLPTHFLGDIVPSATILGPLLPSLGNEYNVGPIPVIAPGCHDTASAIAAVPTASESATPDWCYISSGTWSLMGIEIENPIINDKSFKHNYTNEGGVGGRIRFLKNIMGLWLVQECRRHWQKKGRDFTYTELTQLAGDAAPFSAQINPDHGPFLNPGDMPPKIEAFCAKTNQRPPHDPGQFIRTCLESLALTYRQTIEGMEDVLGSPINTIHIVGGGAQNELLNQMTADACNRTVIAGPFEATAAGNILTQGLATGHVKNLPHLRSIIRNSFPLKTYTPQNTPIWDKAYTRHRELVGH